jgi:hypothetical protein
MPTSMLSRSRERLEQAVQERARQFEGSALLSVLGELGYEDRDVILHSRLGFSRPHSLIHAVEFQRLPRRRAVVTVNIGLLGSETPLPSYMQRLIEDSPDRLAPFFEYFDHAILRSRLRAQWPERDPELGSDWEKTRRATSKLVRLDSPVMAHWLFRRVYPELEVNIRRAPSKRTIPTRPVVLGKTAIGDGSALGGVTDLLCAGLAATIVANDATTTSGQPWAEEAARRVREQILPNIIDSEMGITVTLVIRDKPSHLQLSPSSFLGLQPLLSGSTSTKVMIFDGPIQDIGARTQLVGQTIAAPVTSQPSAPESTALVDATSAPRHGALPPTVTEEQQLEHAEAADHYLARLQ